MVSDFIRAFPAYTIGSMKRELSRRQITAMLETFYKRPYTYSCLIEPKGN